jgi:hypothetical protein
MKTIEENNRMIAEFMGWKKGHPELFELRWSDEWFNDKEKMTTRGHLHFDTSWDWLMPVVQEIKLSIEISDRFYETLDRLESDRFYETLDRLDNSLMDINIQQTYENVVDIIEWYNENK